MINLKRILSVAIASIIMITLFPVMNVLAAPSASMSITGNTEVGSIITASVSISSDGLIGGYNGSFSYDNAYFELQSISIGNYTSGNFSTNGANFADYGFSISSGTVVKAKFKCLTAGTGSISCYFEDVGDDVGTSFGSASCGTSVTISTSVPKSSNSNLSSLTVSPGTLSPSFSKTTKSYSMSVAEDQSKITVSATPEDGKAAVSLNGVQKNIKPGSNTVKVTVTAEDGTTSVYSIVVTRASGPTGTPTPTPEPLPLMAYLDEELMILPIDELTVIPEGFAADFSKYKGVQIPVVKGKASPTSTEDILLVLLVTDTGSKFFVYDPAQQIVYPFIFISQGAISLQVLQASEALSIPVGYEAFPFEYQGDTITAYRLISDPGSKQILIYVKNAEGEGVLYYYDTELLMLMPYRGEVQIVATTPTPAVTSTESVTSLPSEASTLPTESGLSESKSLGNNLTDFKNPLTILFYLVSLIALVLIAAVVTLLLTRNSAYSEEIENAIDDDDSYLPEDNHIPSPVVTPENKDYFQSFGNVVPPSSDEARAKSPPVSETPDFKPTASVQVVKRPVASDTPVMGVRAINLDSIPGLSTPSEVTVNPSNVVFTPSATPIPVRLKQELEAERLITSEQIAQVPDKVVPPDQVKQIPSENQSKSGLYYRVLDFPDLSRNTDKKPKMDKPFNDPDME